MRSTCVFFILTTITCVDAAVAQAPPLPQRVLYVGSAQGERAKQFEDFLRNHFNEVRVAERVDFDPKSADSSDVVLLDWSQREAPVGKGVCPFGELENWRKPTVLLGSAGLLLAGKWELIGAAG